MALSHDGELCTARVATLMTVDRDAYNSFIVNVASIGKHASTTASQIVSKLSGRRTIFVFFMLMHTYWFPFSRRKNVIYL